MRIGSKVKLVTVLVLAGVSAVAAYGAGNITVKWSAYDVTGLSLQGGLTPVPDGSRLQIGIFTTAPTTGSADLTHFVPFATADAMGQGGFSGFWSTIESTGLDTGFAGQRLYLVAFNSNVTASATQIGIFTSTSSEWLFPTYVQGNPNTILPDIQHLVDSPGTAGNALKTTATVVLGGGPVYDSGNGYSWLQLAAIPEPSSILLVVGGLFGLFAFRRNRR